MRDVRLLIHLICRATRLYRLTALSALGIPGWAQAFGEQATVGVSDLPPISASVRATWVLHSRVGPTRMFVVPVQSAVQTWADSPREYNTHWSGFGSRVGSTLATSALSNTMEASIGELWGEDPRYHRLGSGRARARIRPALKMAFMAENASGDLRPAYARFIAVPSSRIISNSWRVCTEGSRHLTTRESSRSRTSLCSPVE